MHTLGVPYHILLFIEMVKCTKDQKTVLKQILNNLSEILNFDDLWLCIYLFVTSPNENEPYPLKT